MFNRLKQKIKQDPVRAIEATFRIPTADGKIVSYKVAQPHKLMFRTGLIGDRSRLFRIINKGRQGGFSFFQGVEGCAIAQRMPNTHQYYVATREQQAKSWLKKVEALGKNSRVNFDNVHLIDIDVGKSSLLEKVFKHMPKGAMKDIQESYIAGFSASPAGIRGETGIKVILDEFPNMIQRENQQKDVYAAIGYFVAQGGGCDIQGTPLVKSDMFWDMYSNSKQYLMTPFYFPIIENWEQLNLEAPLVIKLDDFPGEERDRIMALQYQGHSLYKIRDGLLLNKKIVDNVAVQPMKIPYLWYDWGFLEQKRNEDLSLFRQEILGIPEDVNYRFIPPELYLPCVTLHEDLICNYKRQYKMAIDVAQTRDMTAITVGYKSKSGVVKEVYSTQMQGLYPMQKKEITKIASYWPTMTDIIIDNTGPGRGLADELYLDSTLPHLIRTEFASTVDIGGVKKLKITELLATEFKKALYHKRYEAIPSQVAMAHVLRVERIATDTFNIKYTGKRKNGRDDHFWSKCLLNLAFNDKYAKLLEIDNISTIGVMPDIKEDVKKPVVVREADGDMLFW